MKDGIFVVTAGSLLHDIGKVICRAEGFPEHLHNVSGAEYVKRYSEDNRIIDCIRLHCFDELKKTAPEPGSMAYIVCLADYITSGFRNLSDKGTSDVFDKNRPLFSIYNLLNNGNGTAVYYPSPISEKINNPEEYSPRDLSIAYKELLAGFAEGILRIGLKMEYTNTLLELCEKYFSFIPSDVYIGQTSDISLFDHSKITAAFASCILPYMETSGRMNFRYELLEKREAFCGEKAFVLFSMGISGIQQFIYNISYKGALKGLRARSFYLELMLENTIDEILDGCHLSRANLLYSGGGQSYMLLPNTEETINTAKKAIRAANASILERFGTTLFMTYGYQPCTANELMSMTNDTESYRDIFRSITAQVSAMKLRRYEPEDIRLLNSGSSGSKGRECSVCGASGNLIMHNDRTMCETCAAFEDISGEIIRQDMVLAVLNEKLYEKSVPLFSSQGGLWASPVTPHAAKVLLESRREKVVRFYTKNSFYTGLPFSSNLWTGDYPERTENAAVATFEELAAKSSGIERIGILRADADNLGSTFINGFVREHEADKYKYVTISRTAALSRSLTLFFKYYINTLLKEPEYFLVEKRGQRNAVIVYAGGDDIFIAGAWDEVLSFAVDLRRALVRYTGGRLALSAGFAIFDYKYPLSLMAEETAELEEAAKKNEYASGAKNSISLFGLESINGALKACHTYDWDTFENKVLSEKFEAIKKMYSVCGEYGNAFLYNIMQLLRQAEEDRINIARLAYLLARREPGKGAPLEVKEEYSRFSANVYNWAVDCEERKQLITALILYIYTIREKEEDSENDQCR